MAKQIHASEVLGMTERLIDKSLLFLEGFGGYRMLQTVREFGLEQLSAASEEEKTKRNHFEYFSGFAKKSESRIRGPQQHDWYIKYIAAQDDLRAALDFGFARCESAPAASEMTFDLSTFWFNSSNFREAVNYYDQALKACPPGDSDLRARLLRRGAMMRLYGGDDTAGRTMLEALDMALRVGSEQTIADAYFSLGLQSKDPREAIDHLGEALSRFEKLDDNVGIAFSLAGIAEVAFVDGDYATSRTFYKLAVARAMATGDVRAAGASTAALATIDLVEGHIEEARLGFQSAIVMILEAGVVFNMYSMFPLVIQFIQKAGDQSNAARLIGWCERLRRSVGGIRDRMDQYIYDQVDQGLSDQLGPELYAELLAEGAALNDDDAVALANESLIVHN